MPVRNLRLLSAAFAIALAASLTASLAGCTPAAGGSASALAAGDPHAPGAPSGEGALSGGGAPSDGGAPTTADGFIPDGSVLTLDSDEPAITRLDPALLDALRQADAAAEQRGTTITVADGWRSLDYQHYLFAQAVEKYGSEEEAEKWVRRGDDSAHVRGAAVDIATADAMDFLSRFGAEWGLCQAYANEAWHFELLTTPGGECPPMSPDGRG